MATSPALIQSTVRHAVYLEGLKSGEVNQFAAFLKRIDKSLRERLTREDLTDFSRARLEKLLKSVDKSMKGIFDEYYDELAGHLAELSEYESEFEARNLYNVVKTAGFESVIPSAGQVRAAVFSAPLSVRGPNGGSLLESFVKDFSTTERKRVVGAIRQGYFEGQTNFQIIKNLRGTKANGYRDGILATTSRNAEAIVRTAVQHVASTARFETWKSNSDIVTGYRIVATLDGRTSHICRSLDGNVYKLGKGPLPPFHIRCRTTHVAELDGRFDFLKEGRTRASQDGPVSADLNYYEWLKLQSGNFQDDVLGVTRGNLFRNGGLSAKKFAKLNLNRNFKPLTLAEMRKKEPQAFEKSANAQALTKQAENARIRASQQQQTMESWVGQKQYRSLVGATENPRIKKLADGYDLTQAERAALRHYTGTGYHDLNRVMRGQAPSGGAGKRAIIASNGDVLRDALKKLPDHKGRVIRRDYLPDNVLARHKVGSIVEYEAFTSATFGETDVMLSKPHRLVIVSKSGKKIDWISKYGKDEEEVLFNSPTKFVVRKRAILKNGDIEISLMELPNE